MSIVYTIRILHRIINGEDNTEYYLSVLKQISENSYYDKKLEMRHYILCLFTKSAFRDSQIHLKFLNSFTHVNKYKNY